MTLEHALLELLTACAGTLTALGGVALLRSLRERDQRRRAQVAPGFHTHKWHDRPYLTDGNVDVYRCQVPGCRVEKREPHAGAI